MKQTEMKRTGFPRRLPGTEPKPKTVSCKECKVRFLQPRLGAKVCSAECAILFAEKQRQKIRLAQDKKKRAEAKKDRMETRKKLEGMKTRTEYANDAQRAVNLYVKWRDWGKPCVSCGRPHNQEVVRDASHLKSRGANSALRFHLWNLNMACVQCNMSNSGNIAEYYPRLIERIGQEKVDYLHYAKRERKYEKEYLIRMKKIFTKKAKRQQKRLGL